MIIEEDLRRYSIGYLIRHYPFFAFIYYIIEERFSTTKMLDGLFKYITFNDALVPPPPPKTIPKPTNASIQRAQMLARARSSISEPKEVTRHPVVRLYDEILPLLMNMMGE